MSGMIHCAVSINNGPEVSGTLTIEVEQIDVTMATKTEPDMKWEHVDAQGHFHAYAEDRKLPTLETRSEHVPCSGGCGDDECAGYDITVYVCAICGEKIEPKVITTHPVSREFVSGRTSWGVKVDQRVERGERVSVKVTAGEHQFFGIGVAGNMSAEGGSDGIRFTTTIHDASPLGQRKVRAKASA